MCTPFRKVKKRFRNGVLQMCTPFRKVKAFFEMEYKSGALHFDNAFTFRTVVRIWSTPFRKRFFTFRNGLEEILHPVPWKERLLYQEVSVEDDMTRIGKQQQWSARTIQRSRIEIKWHCGQGRNSQTPLANGTPRPPGKPKSFVPADQGAPRTAKLKPDRNTALKRQLRTY